MLGLRTCEGISIDKFNQTFNADFLSEYKDVLEKKQKYLSLTGDILKIKEQFLFVQNDILLDFMKD